MHNALLITAAVLAAAVISVLAYAATKPDSFQVQRTAAIRAAPEKIRDLICDYHTWPQWSPYENDPSMKRTYSGQPTGQGAIYEWDGKKMGAGRVEIVETTPTLVGMKLDMLRPFQCHNMAEFTLAPRGDSTDVTWTLRGESTYMSKVMTTFCSMDRMVGGQFEEGLANLKTIAER